MDKISKFLQKLSVKERENIFFLIGKILSLELDSLDIKKMKTNENYYRVRKGKIRIIFEIKNNEAKIIDINYRKDIYK